MSGFAPHWKLTLQVALLHALVIVALFQGPTARDWAMFAVVYPLAFAGVGIGLHRYFAHRAFETSRVFQFVLALMPALTYGDAIRFAGKHRLHHRFADTTRDVHAPMLGAWQCWFGSILSPTYSDDQMRSHARDWLRYPELRLLSRFSIVPGLVLGVAAYAVGGITMLGIGACLPTVVLIHQTAMVNYFCHKNGSRRYDTADTSTNNFLVALLTCGEGWHNNHHRHPHSARAGEAWWEIDVFYYLIVLFRLLGLVWNVRTPALGASRPLPEGDVHA